MKKAMMTLAMAAIGLAAMAGNPSKGSETFKVDAAQSTAKWHAKKVTGEHFGTVKFENGAVEIAKNKLVGGLVSMDMSSIDVTDLTGEWHDKLVGHLRSDDFFAVEKHKIAMLKIKSATPIVGAVPGQNNYNVKADLTIKGITKEIAFPAMVVITDEKVIANADLMIDRTQFDIRYGSKSFFENIGDKAIADEFNIKVRLVGTK